MSEEVEATSLRRSLTSHFVLQVVELGAQLYFCYYLRGRGSLQVAHSLLLLASLLAFNGLSLVWVRRGLDFAGRRCGKVVCYFMHAALLAHVWRYLKLRLAFDAADVTEFRLLRLAQVHIQTLPLTALEVGIVLWTEVVDAGALGAIALQLLFAAASIALPISPSTQLPEMSSQGQAVISEDKCESVSLLKKCLTCVQVACFLWSRLLAFAVFAILFRFWIVLVASCHCLGCFLWLRTLGCSGTVQVAGAKRANQNTSGRRQQSSEQSSSLLHYCYSAYVLLFYLHLHRIKSKRDFLGVVAFNLLTTLENAAKIFLWCYYSPQPSQFKMDTACVAGVGTLVGALLLVLLNTCRLSSCTSGLLRASEGGVCLPWTPQREVSWTKGEERERPTNTYINIREIQQVLGTNKGFPDGGKNSSASWKSCGDHMVSPGWSTDNGSSNSRNTNTLDPGRPRQNPCGVRGASAGDEEGNLPRCGSVSSSFSSLSCGTVNKKGAESRKPAAPTTAPVSEAAPVAAASGACHCTLFDKANAAPYGIYIWDDKSIPSTSKSPGLFHVQKKLQVVCAACLQSHDPLLTDCQAAPRLQKQLQEKSSSSTDYPSPSECTGYYPDSADSCTTWPKHFPQMASMLRAGFSGVEYVQAWLLSSDPPRGGRLLTSTTAAQYHHEREAAALAAVAAAGGTRRRRVVRRKQVRRRYRPRSSSLPSRHVRRKTRVYPRPNRRTRLQAGERTGLVNPFHSDPLFKIVQDVETIV